MNRLAHDGFDLTRITPALFGNLRGMMAAVPIRKGDALFAFPLDKTMDLARTPECPCPQLVDANFWETSQMWYVKMGLWLVAGRHSQKSAHQKARLPHVQKFSKSRFATESTAEV